MKEWTKEHNNKLLKKICITTNRIQYKNILKFIIKNGISNENCLIDNIKIKWKAYTGTPYSDQNVSVLFHTWCDFFTQENLIFEDNIKENHRYLLEVPDGWIKNNILYSLEITNVEGRHGFAGYGSVKKIFDLSNFFNNFSKIICNGG